MASSDTRTQQYLGVAAHGNRADLPTATCCETRTQTLVREVAERIITEEETRAAADRVLQGEIDEIRNNPDVVDIVATYAALQAYDTTYLTDKDVIRVLADENHNDESTYYRWSTATQTWTYIGESKQYSDFVGTDGTNAGTSGLVPAPQATDAGKFLKADGTWGEAGSSVNVVQTSGTSTTDVMSQNATTSMVYADPSTRRKVNIGTSTIASSTNYGVAIGAATLNTQYGGVAIGESARIQSSSNNSIALGAGAQVGANNANSIVLGNAAISNGYGQNIAIGDHAKTENALGRGMVSLGAYSSATAQGQFDIGSTQIYYGYNNSNYRLLTGLYDPQSDHDAATKGYVDTTVSTAGGATLTNAEFNTIFGTNLTEES